jgi:hypothetical protein
MANRAFYTPQCQSHKAVILSVLLLGGGSGGALSLANGNGDPNGTYFSTARTGTGVYTVTTKDAFPLALGVHASLVLNTAATNVFVVEGPLPTHNSNGTWTFTFNVFEGGSAADLGTTDGLRLTFFLHNSSVTA